MHGHLSAGIGWNRQTFSIPGRSGESRALYANQLDCNGFWHARFAASHGAAWEVLRVLSAFHRACLACRPLPVAERPCRTCSGRIIGRQVGLYHPSVLETHQSPSRAVPYRAVPYRTVPNRTIPYSTVPYGSYGTPHA